MLEAINDLSEKLRKRMFYIVAVTGIIANSLGFIANYLIYGWGLPTIICGICDLLIITASMGGYICKQERSALLFILLLVNVFEFPYLFYIYGTRTIVYMILGCVGVYMFVKGKTLRYNLLAAAFLILYDVVIIVYTYFTTAVFGVINPEAAFASTLCSYLIAVSSIIGLISLWLIQTKAQKEELLRMAIDMRHIAETDALTKAYNRRYLTQQLDKLINERKNSFSLALIDIDNFKNINDTYGHIFGDAVLVKLCEIIKTHIGAKDMLARFGGEEFIIVFNEAGPADIDAALAKISQEFAEFGFKEKQQRFTFSGGVEEYKKCDEITKLYQNVDRKLYKAKNNGKNMIIWQD